MISTREKKMCRKIFEVDFEIKMQIFIYLLMNENHSVLVIWRMFHFAVTVISFSPHEQGAEWR